MKLDTLRRLGIILAAVLVLTIGSRAQTVVQCQNNVTTSSAATNTIPITTASGHLLAVVVAVGASGSDTWTITDDGGNTYTKSPNTFTSGPAGSAPTFGIFYVPNAAAITSVVVHFIPNAAVSTAFVLDFSGMATSGVIENAPDNGGTSSTTATSAALSTVNAQDVLLYAVGMNSTVTGITPDAGYTIPTNCSAARSAVQYKIVSATQSGVTTSMSWTTARDYASLFTGFKAAAVGRRSPIFFGM